MLQITIADVTASLDRLQSGLSQYCWIQDHVGCCDVSTSAEFQKRFNGFYRVRRGQAWRSSFYRLMEGAKCDGIEFSAALGWLRRETGMVEASFASKLVATLDPCKPVIDSVVLSHFGLRLPYQTLNRESKVIDIYRRLSEGYAELTDSSLGLMIRDLFDQRYPCTNLTPLKKVDLVLWQVRPPR